MGPDSTGLGGVFVLWIELRFDQVVRGQNLGVVGESGPWSCQMRLGRVIHRLHSDCE